MRFFYPYFAYLNRFDSFLYAYEKFLSNEYTEQTLSRWGLTCAYVCMCKDKQNYLQQIPLSSQWYQYIVQSLYVILSLPKSWVNLVCSFYCSWKYLLKPLYQLYQPKDFPKELLQFCYVSQNCYQPDIVSICENLLPCPFI